MTDRELLALAAKAAGYKFTTDGVNKQRGKDGIAALWIDLPMMTGWNPLENDGYALRLAVALGIVPYVDVVDDNGMPVTSAKVFRRTACTELHGQDPCAATRRAIVRAAAEIGKVM